MFCILKQLQRIFIHNNSFSTSQYFQISRFDGGVGEGKSCWKAKTLGQLPGLKQWWAVQQKEEKQRRGFQGKTWIWFWIACWVYFGGKILQTIGTVGLNFGRGHGWRHRDLRVTIYGWVRSPKERAQTGGRGGRGKHSCGENIEHKYLQGRLRRHRQRGRP